jgi:membrane protease subunit (stomatin/prohibitin family)
VVLSTSPDNFGQYGVEINKISGLTISLPDEVQKAIDTRSEMSVLGVNYMQYQAGQAMTEAASNPSGGAGSLAGLGAGFGAGSGIGYAMGGQMAQGMNQPPSKSCIKCGTIISASNNFCPNCGADQKQTPSQQQGAKFCPNCGSTVSAGSKFCANCGNKIAV